MTSLHDEAQAAANRFDNLYRRRPVLTHPGRRGGIREAALEHLEYAQFLSFVRQELAGLIAEEIAAARSMGANRRDLDALQQDH